MKKRDVFIAAAVAGVAALAGKSANATTLGPVLAVVSHQVKDYAAWRAFFGQAAPFREKTRSFSPMYSRTRVTRIRSLSYNITRR